MKEAVQADRSEAQKAEPLLNWERILDRDEKDMHATTQYFEEIQVAALRSRIWDGPPVSRENREITQRQMTPYISSSLQ
jgi:hypothetical protein